MSTNHVLSVSVTTPRAWAGLQGFNISPAQNWSTYDGVSFWFKGTNSGKTFLYVITQDGGAGLYQAPFIDIVPAGNMSACRGKPSNTVKAPAAHRRSA